MSSEPVLVRAGASPATACLGAVIVHGRDASAEHILGLAERIGRDDVAYIAPDAPGHCWYPRTFTAPLADNEPGVSNGIAAIRRSIATLAEDGIPHGRILLIGFSQGACLSLETMARFPLALGGVAALSGGLIGTGERPGRPPPADKLFDYRGRLDGVPVLFGCNEADRHIPLPRVLESERVFAAMGAETALQIFPEPGHRIYASEIDWIAALMHRLASSSPVG
ncbi:MAG: alpha/beta fold hydrolase [Pseudomonadota bacterium]